MRVPARLHSGARVGLAAPAGPLRDDMDLERASATVRSYGWEPVIAPHALDRDGYLAGTDLDRAADLDAFARDDTIDAIWCIRGGYGAMRILESLDYDAWRRHPKILIGYSDVTALHAAIGARVGVVTYHGPTAREQPTPFSAASLATAVTTGGNPCGVAPSASIVVPGQARGRLAGGNLALLAALAGTPFAPSLDDTILILEDVNEPVYRIDRMLLQLRLAGALDGVRGLALGQFTEIPDDDANAQRPLERVIDELADRCGIPCLLGLPIGHLPEQWTVPLGALATLDADQRTLTVE